MIEASATRRPWTPWTRSCGSTTASASTPSGQDFQRAELLSLPITLVILVVAFGALVAAGLPLLLGLTAVAALDAAAATSGRACSSPA